MKINTTLRIMICFKTYPNVPCPTLAIFSYLEISGQKGKLSADAFNGPPELCDWWALITPTLNPHFWRNC